MSHTLSHPLSMARAVHDFKDAYRRAQRAGKPPHVLHGMRARLVAALQDKGMTQSEATLVTNRAADDVDRRGDDYPESMMP